MESYQRKAIPRNGFSTRPSPRRSDYSPVQSLAPGSQEAGSRAVAAAMKALQDKIKWLEEGNFRLIRELEACELQAREDIEAYKHRTIALQEQLQAQAEQLAVYSLDKDHSEQLLLSLSRQLQQSQQLFASQGTQARELQDRVAALERQVEQQGRENSLLQANLAQAEADRAKLQGNRRDLEEKMRRKVEEIDTEKESAETMKNSLSAQFQELQKATNRRNDEFQALLREANTHNQHLASQLQAKDLHISQSQAELTMLKRAHLISESARATLSQEAEKARKLVYDLSISHDGLVQSIRSPGRGKGKAEGGEMMQLERELSQLNEEYQSVLRRAEMMDLRQLRGKLSSLAEQMEAKNEQLANLRRKTLTSS